jgi:hypothetical protein
VAVGTVVDTVLHLLERVGAGVAAGHISSHCDEVPVYAISRRCVSTLGRLGAPVNPRPVPRFPPVP